MNRDILALIQENMDTFSKGQKRIANYILGLVENVQFDIVKKLNGKEFLLDNR